MRGRRDLATIVGRAAIISAAEWITASGQWINDRAWFRYFDPATLPSPSYATRIVQSWDIAMQTNEKNGFSVCTTWRVEKNVVYLFDLFRGRLEYPDLRRKVIALAHQHRPATILIEDAGPGMSLLQICETPWPQV